MFCCFNAASVNGFIQRQAGFKAYCIYIHTDFFFEIKIRDETPFLHRKKERQSKRRALKYCTPTPLYQVW